MTGGETLVAVVGLVCGGVGTYVGLRLVPIEQHLTDRKEARKQEADALEKRLEGLHGVREKLEARIVELEKNSVSRAAFDDLRRDLETVVDRSADRVMKHFDDTATRLEKRLERVEEARS